MTHIRVLFFFFVFCFVAILVKLFYIQILAGDSFATDYTSTKKILPERGKIFDRNRQPLAVNQTTYLMYGEPKMIKDKEETVEELEKITKLGEATLSARIDMSKVWVSIRGGITEETKNQISKLKLPGIGFDEERIRFYPESSLSAHLLGFVGKNNKGENTGYFGVEGYYDKDLAGFPGVMKSERDLIGRPIFIGTQDFVPPNDGRDFILTIDKSVQHIVKSKLVATNELIKAKEACVIVTDPYTMEILAYSCLPDFDPDNYGKFTESFFKSWAISNLYEPGSTFKPLVMAAAIEEKAVKPTETFDEDGSVTVSGYRIQNWNDKYEGEISMTRILEKSSNIGMVYTGKKLGEKKMYSYLEKYGFGSLTGIDMQGEVTGTLRPPNQWYPIDYATTAFGQGVVVTPLQLLRGFAAVVNGGKLMRPHVVKAIVEDGVTKQVSPKMERRVLSESTSEIMRKMLSSVIDNAEARWDKPEGYTFGGKTGTAQIAAGGDYDATKTIASFIGFAPADKPKFLMMVVMREPGSSSWGSETAAPLFFDIATDLLVYYNVPREQE